MTDPTVIEPTAAEKAAKDEAIRADAAKRHLADGTLTPAEAERRQNEAALFGPDPVRGRDGLPMERGIGSKWQGATHAARTHYMLVERHALIDNVMAAHKVLADAVAKLEAASKEALTYSAQARDEAAPKPQV